MCFLAGPCGPEVHLELFSTLMPWVEFDET